MFHLLLAAAPVSLLPCAALHLPASVYIAATAARPAVYQQRARCAVAIIEPSIYQELAIYDMKMEQSVNDLESQLTQARQEAAESNRRLDTLEETVNTLQTESAQQRAEAESLRQQLDKQEKQAKANAAAASKLEEETRRLLKELDDKGVEHSMTLERETNKLKALLDDQSTEAQAAKEKYAKVIRMAALAVYRAIHVLTPARALVHAGRSREASPP